MIHALVNEPAVAMKSAEVLPLIVTRTSCAIESDLPMGIIQIVVLSVSAGPGAKIDVDRLQHREAFAQRDSRPGLPVGVAFDASSLKSIDAVLIQVDEQH